ncbi:ABC transporter permease [Desulfovirgula thermocuniculi]|uniref:ABC transporter permease n=1 Tax=Desulfovirgula thermocuniculi TaxID=348842 RepID=UPI000416B56A|nr:ABC transporter permease [Desulfovirgula thermocuniculi]
MTVLSDIYYVCWREMKRFWQHKPRILVVVFQPLVWLVLMGNMMSGLTSNPFASRMLGVERYIDFMTPGVMIMTALFGGIFSGVSLLWDRRIGFLSKMLVAPVSRVAIPVGKMLATAMQGAIQVAVIALVALFLGVKFKTGLGGFLCLLFIAALFCFAMAGVSLSVAIWVKTIEGLHPILNFFTMPMVFSSNAIFPEAAMPSWLRVVSAWNPLSYAVTAMRALIVEGWAWGKILSGLMVTLLFAFAMVLVATCQFKRSLG